MNLHDHTYSSPEIVLLYTPPQTGFLDYSTVKIDDGELEDWGEI